MCQQGKMRPVQYIMGGCWPAAATAAAADGGRKEDEEVLTGGTIIDVVDTSSGHGS